MDAKRVILQERWTQRELNYQEDLHFWKIIRDTKNLKSKISIHYDTDKKNWYSKYEELIDGKYKNNSVLAERCKSYAQRIFRVHAPIFGIEEENQVTPEMIIELVNMYLELPKHIQLHFCRDPSRQTFDESIQISLLEKNLENLTVDQLKNGQFTLTDGKITSDMKSIPADQSSRSIDVKISNNKGNEYFGFLKYANPIGSVTSSLQPGEAFSFLNQCKKYVSNTNNPKNHFFFLQVDGVAGEKEIPKMIEYVKQFKNIHAGNTSSVIDWIKNNEI